MGIGNVELRGSQGSPRAAASPAAAKSELLRFVETHGSDLRRSQWRALSTRQGPAPQAVRDFADAFRAANPKTEPQIFALKSSPLFLVAVGTDAFAPSGFGGPPGYGDAAGDLFLLDANGKLVANGRYDFSNATLRWDDRPTDTPFESAALSYWGRPR